MQAFKGHLVAIGGNEDKGDGKPPQQNGTHLNFASEGVLEEITKLLRGNAPVIEVITTASDIPDEYFQGYKTAFKKLGVTARHLDLQTRTEAEDPAILERLHQCDGIMFTGGDQTRLTAILGGTAFHTLLKERLVKESFVIGGTSAGAACMSDTMVESGSPEKGNIKGELKLTLGFGFVNGIIIDTHFNTRGRFGRLAEAIASQPGIIGIGLGEDTGLVINGKGQATAIGSDSVYILDGSHMSYTNIAAVKNGEPVTIARIDTYLISRYDHYDIHARQFTPDPAKGKLA